MWNEEVKPFHFLKLGFTFLYACPDVAVIVKIHCSEQQWWWRWHPTLRAEWTICIHKIEKSQLKVLRIFICALFTVSSLAQG